MAKITINESQLREMVLGKVNEALEELSTKSLIEEAVKKSVRKVLMEDMAPDGKDAGDHFKNDVLNTPLASTDVYGEESDEDGILYISMDMNFSDGHTYHIYLTYQYRQGLVAVNGMLKGERGEQYEFDDITDPGILQKVSQMVERDVEDILEEYGF